MGLLEQLADTHAPATDASSSNDAQPELAAAGGSSVRAVQLAEVLPLLGERQVEQLMARLLQVTEVRGVCGLWAMDWCNIVCTALM